MARREWTDHLPPTEITAEEYQALPADLKKRIEVVDGSAIVRPNPSQRHQQLVTGLWVALRRLCPRDLDARMEVDLRLLDAPLHNRRPDVVVYRRDVKDADILLPEEVALVVEVMSPSSQTTDRVHKPAEYSAAGIQHYWRIELDERDITAYVFRADASGRRYSLLGEAQRDRLIQHEPFPVDLDLHSRLG
ncbi:MAG: Uma2 family endonuclease [Candidatus Dormibacteraeota bacterium]|nr:Uma2 family endonuclease [Candidatus Dormibacteraeota bacterium]